MADISVYANQILAGGGFDENGDALPKLLLRLVSAGTTPPSYYLATGDVTINGIESIVAGASIEVDNTDPNNPIISVIGGGSNSIAILSGGSVGNVRDGKFVGLGRSFNNSISNTDPDAPDFASTVPVAGVLQYFAVRLGSAAGVGANTVTVYKNGVATDLVITLAEGNTHGVNTVDTVSVTAEDLLTVGVESENDNVVMNAWACGFFSSVSGGGTGIQSVVAGDGVAVDNTDPANPIVSANPTAIYGASFSSFTAGNYLGISRHLSSSFTNADASSKRYGTRMHGSGTLRGFNVQLDGNVVDPHTITIYKNGVASTISAVITTGDIGADTTHSLAFVDNDIVMVGPETTPDAGVWSWSIGVSYD